MKNIIELIDLEVATIFGGMMKEVDPRLVVSSPKGIISVLDPIEYNKGQMKQRMETFRSAVKSVCATAGITTLALGGFGSVVAVGMGVGVAYKMGYLSSEKVTEAFEDGVL